MCWNVESVQEKSKDKNKMILPNVMQSWPLVLSSINAHHIFFRRDPYSVFEDNFFTGMLKTERGKKSPGRDGTGEGTRTELFAVSGEKDAGH